MFRVLVKVSMYAKPHLREVPIGHLHEGDVVEVVDTYAGMLRVATGNKV